MHLLREVVGELLVELNITIDHKVTILDVEISEGVVFTIQKLVVVGIGEQVYTKFRKRQFRLS